MAEPRDSRVARVFISKGIDHPALNVTTKGIVDGLARCGYARGKNLVLRVESAQGSVVMASQIAAHFVAHHPDILIGVGTVSAQSMIKYSRQYSIPLLFSSVTNPKMAGLDVDGLDYVSGVSNFVSPETLMSFFVRTVPNLKVLGMLYNPLEINSGWIVEQMRLAAVKFGVKIKPQAVMRVAEVNQSVIKLAYQSQAIFVSNDNTVLSAIRHVSRVANSVGVPLYISDIDAMGSGALAALGPDQYEIGSQTAQMACKVLKGREVRTIPIEFPDSVELVIDKRVVALLGVNIPRSIVEQARMIP